MRGREGIKAGLNGAAQELYLSTKDFTLIKLAEKVVLSKLGKYFINVSLVRGEVHGEDNNVIKLVRHLAIVVVNILPLR